LLFRGFIAKNKDIMLEALEKIQSLIREAKTFALFSEKNSEDCKLLAMEALKKGLSEKNLAVFSLPDHPEFRKKWSRILGSDEIENSSRQTSIRIPKSQYKIKELSCEENNDFLSLVITSEKGELNKDAIIFEPIPLELDAAFCFFEPHDSDMLSEFEKQFVLPPKEKIVFLSLNEKTFAEKIFQIIKAISPAAHSLPNVSTLLFASLISETNNFIRPISQEALRLGSELLSLNADKETIKNILNEEKTFSFARLLGRALARTHTDETSDASWTFLSKKDLEKTENLNPSPSLFHDIVRNLRDLIPSRLLSLVFWPASPSSQGGQNDNNIFAMAAADEEEKLVPLARNLGVSLQSKFFVAGPFQSFSEAELRFRKALQDVSSLKI
jgi:hypothetical protein